MKIEIEVPEYSPEDGLQMEWEPDTAITTEVAYGAIRILANRDGLISLARLLLTLADAHVAAGYHWHLDASNSLENDSVEVIIEKA